jgi:hypothetical protein
MMSYVNYLVKKGRREKGDWRLEEGVGKGIRHKGKGIRHKARM